MKIALVPVLLVMAVLLAGCTGAAPATAPANTAPAAIPDIRGEWSGPMAGYEEGIGFTDYAGMKITMVVEEQHDRLFSGYIVFNGTESKKSVAGAIGRDGKTITMVEKDGGFSDGMIYGPGEIELTYMQDTAPFSIALDTLRKKT
jgi:hypothetical protein